MIDKEKSIYTLEQTLGGKSNFSITSKDQFNKCVEHICQLISDAYTLFTNDSFSSSVFLSIAVIEEVAKVHTGIYIEYSGENVKKDKLRDHKTKEIIGLNYTICYGERIKNAIDNKQLEEIFQMSYSGELKSLREKAIYCEYKDGSIIVPESVINKQFSKNILLVAIESFDDNLVGYSDYSIVAFERWTLFLRALGIYNILM